MNNGLWSKSSKFWRKLCCSSSSLSLMWDKIWFSDSNLWVSSRIWALKTEFSASMLRKSWVVRLILEIIWFLLSLSWLTCAISPSKCCCFLILDLLADSLFDCIRFLFLWSINCLSSSSEPELWFWSTIWDNEPEEFPLEQSIIIKKKEEKQQQQHYNNYYYYIYIYIYIERERDR